MDFEGMDFGCAWGDYDNDGDMDLYVGNVWYWDYNSYNLLYRNNQNDQNYLKVRFLSANGSFSRYGSRIYIYREGTDSLVGTREIDGGSGLYSQNMYDAHFGLDGTQSYDIVIRSTVRVNGENIILDKTIKPELGGVVPIEVGGFIEVRDTVDTYVGVSEGKPQIPKTITLYQNYPNPFNRSTTIPFSIHQPGQVQLTIYNVNGQVAMSIDREYPDSGEHTIRWDGRNRRGKVVSSGIYLYRIKVSISKRKVFTDLRKMILLK
jgi:hypothetical protein